jgi:hypothetical protein
VDAVKGALLSSSETGTGHDHVINDLDDVTTDGAIEGDALVYTGFAWVPSAVVGGSTADEVNIRTDQPPDTVELWIDTDDVYPLTMALGKVALASYAPAVDPATVFTAVIDIPGLSVTWTSDPTRQYRITVSGNSLQVTNTGTHTLYVTDAANAIQWQQNLTLGASFWGNWSGVSYLSGVSGPVTRKARILSTVASGNVRAQTLYPWTILVEDIGPA